MKKKTIALLVVCLFAVAMFVGCSTQAPAQSSAAASSEASASSQAPAESSAEASSESAEASGSGGLEGKKVALAWPTSSIEVFVQAEKLLVESLEAMGVEVSSQTAEGDVNTQLEQCQNMLANEPDLLVLCAVDADASAQIVEYAAADGVPVLAYYRMAGGEPVAYCADDNYALGPQLAQYIIDNVDGGSIVVITGDPKDTNAKIFRDTAMEVLQPYIDDGTYTVVADQYNDGWSPEAAMAVVENALTQNDNDIQAVLSTNDGMAGGAVEALAAQGLAGQVVVTGGDCELAAAKRLVDGTQSMTLLKNPITINAKVVELIELLLNGEALPATQDSRDNGTMEVPCYFVDMQLFTKDNVGDLVTEGIFTAEELGL